MYLFIPSLKAEKKARVELDTLVCLIAVLARNMFLLDFSRFSRLLQSGAQRVQRSERRSQIGERERRSEKKLVGARVRAALSKKAEL